MSHFNTLAPLGEWMARVLVVHYDMRHLWVTLIAFDDVTTAIRRTVIEQNHLKILIVLCEYAVNALTQIPGVVIVWDDNTNKWLHADNCIVNNVQK